MLILCILIFKFWTKLKENEGKKRKEERKRKSRKLVSIVIILWITSCFPWSVCCLMEC